MNTGTSVRGPGALESSNTSQEAGWAVYTEASCPPRTVSLDSPLPASRSFRGAARRTKETLVRRADPWQEMIKQALADHGPRGITGIPPSYQ